MLHEGSTEARHNGIEGQVLLGAKDSAHGGKGWVSNVLHKEKDLGALVDAFVAIFHQFLDDGMLLDYALKKAVKRRTDAPIVARLLRSED